MKKLKPTTQKVKDTHIRWPADVWEAIVKSALDEQRPPMMQLILLVKRQLGLAK